mmetsp:Transcript_95542/g.270485  ORF Transcript_95542/g.270485 Transcript_95542/m.270485 type:complete len:405 (-) Transcript_95542:200-1414(-)
MADGPESQDRLLQYVGKSQFARDILASIEADGYAVLPDVLAADEVEREYARMWRWVEAVSPGVRRGAPASWARRGGDQDPWPSRQRDMMQLHQAGWVFTELRERLGERVFERLYGTPALHCSKDGFTLQRPTGRELRRTPNDHFDQSCERHGLQCIQGSVALTDQEHDDGCFLCWPGSHRYHQEITRQRQKGGRRDFCILSEGEKQLLGDRGIRPVRVPVKKGAVILWRSDLAHCGAMPLGRRDGFRGVVYVCMLPAVLTPEDVYAQKQRAYYGLQTSSHWPCFEEWFKPARDTGSFKPYFERPPPLTPRQRLLYGLDRYSAGAGPGAAPRGGCHQAEEDGPGDEGGAKKPAKQRRWGRQRPAQPVDGVAGGVGGSSGAGRADLAEVPPAACQSEASAAAGSSG